MRSGPIVIFHVAEQQVTEVALAEHNNVVKAFPSDRTDQPFSISILPRGARRRGSIADAYRSESADKNLAISAVPVTNEIAGSLFPTAGFRDLICDPFCGWMRSSVHYGFSTASRSARRSSRSAFPMRENRASYRSY